MKLDLRILGYLSLINFLQHFLHHNIFFVVAPSRPPGSVTASVHGSTTVKVWWQPIPQQYRHGEVLYYIIRVHATVSGVTTEIQASGSLVTVSSLRPYTNYTVEVAAYTVALGPFSTPPTPVRADQDGMKSMEIIYLNQ